MRKKRKPESMSLYEALSAQQRDLISKHLDSVIEANKTTNLTRIDTREDAMVLHVEDSLSGLDELNAAPSGLYGDLGSGAGYPGIPLAIATGRRTTLIDARLKKVKILDGIIEDLGLAGQIDTFAGRAELLSRKRPAEYTALTARALAKLPVLMELASPLLKRGGKLICYKANIDEAELSHAEEVQRPTGMYLSSQRTFLLDGSMIRKIIVFEKKSSPTINLPRREGQAQKTPL